MEVLEAMEGNWLSKFLIREDFFHLQKDENL